MSMRTLVRIRNLLYECEGVSRLCAGAAWQISGIVGLSAQAAHLALCLLDLFARSIALITTSTGPEHLRPHSVFLIRSGGLLEKSGSAVLPQRPWPVAIDCQWRSFSLLAADLIRQELDEAVVNRSR